MGVLSFFEVFRECTFDAGATHGLLAFKFFGFCGVVGWPIIFNAVRKEQFV